MKYYVDQETGNDANPGTREEPFLTLQKGLSVCAVSGEDEVLLSADDFAAQNLDLSVIAATMIKVTANRGTRCTIDEIIPGAVPRIMIQNGEWFFGVQANIGVNSFDPYERSILFDNATVHIRREKESAGKYVKPQVFYHCNVIVDCAIERHVMLCCEVDWNDDSYWYSQTDFLYYHNRMIIPDGMSDYRVPLYDKLGFVDVMDDVQKDAFYTRGTDTKTSAFLYGFDLLYAPLDSLNGTGFKTGPDIAAKKDGNYTDEDWTYLLGDLKDFRQYLSLGDRIGTTIQNPAMIWMPVVDKRYGDVVYPTTSNGCYYRCVVGGTTDPTEPALWPTGVGETVTDSTITWMCIGASAGDEPIAETYDTPNFVERYTKNLFDEAFILDEKLLYLQGIINSQYGAEGFSFNYQRYGIDIKSLLGFNVAETWDVAGSLLGTVLMLECADTPTGIYEFNKRRNCPLGRLPFHYDPVGEKLYTHRRVTTFWVGANRQYWEDGEDIRIGTVIFVPDPLGSDAWYWFECTSEGTTDAVEPAWDTTFKAYTTDNTVKWRCWGLVATPMVPATVDYGQYGLSEGLPIGGDSYQFRDIDAAYDYVHHYFEYDYTAAVSRQEEEQTLGFGPLATEWNYIAYDIATEQYVVVNSAGIKTCFYEYVWDLRKKDKVPLATIRFDGSGPTNIAAQVILMWGGVIGYDPINYMIPFPTTYVTWPNNVFSYATASRGGFAATQKNNYRTDTILENIFRQVYAVDTSLYRSSIVKDWFVLKGTSIQVGQLMRPPASSGLSEYNTFICTSAGTTQDVAPAFGGVTPGNTITEVVPAPAVGATWMNLGYIAIDWRQIENP